MDQTNHVARIAAMRDHVDPAGVWAQDMEALEHHMGALLTQVVCVYKTRDHSV